MEEFDLFPYTPRGEQKELIEFIRSSVADGKNAVIESGTGTGKTICSLTGVLSDQVYHGFKVVYLTRTKSQQKQVMSEMREINKRRKIFAVALQAMGECSTGLIVYYLRYQLLGSVLRFLVFFIERV